MAHVTFTEVIDPAQGADQFTTPDSGKRFVGVKLEIANAGTGTLDDDANSDVTVVGSDGQTYNADFDSIAGCTNFNNGEFTLAPGGQSIGCVTFQIPTGVTAKQVTFALVRSGSPVTGIWATTAT